MLRLALHNIEFKYENSSELVLKQINIELHDGMKTGIVGDNGCGKTTLLRIINEELVPDTGNIVIKGRKPGYLSQNCQFPDVSAEDFIWMFDSELNNSRKIIRESEDSEAIIHALDIYEKKDGYRKEIMFEKIINEFGIGYLNLSCGIEELSGGEKTKIKIARLLMDEPGFLILDEPTNHLDLESIEWLEDYMSRLEIPYIIVSHDRRFLDSCVDIIWELEDGFITPYTGNYSHYVFFKETELETRKHEYEKNVRKISALKRDFQDKKRWAEQFQPSTGKNGYAPVYEDVTNSGKKAMKRAVNVKRRVERLIDEAEENKPFIKKEKEVIFETGDFPKTDLISVRDISFSYDSRTVLKDISLDLKRGERIHVKGRNGSGKTTFLKILAGLLIPDSGMVRIPERLNMGYFCQQHSTLDSELNIKGYIMKDGADESYVRTVLGCLNIRGDKVYSPIKELSPGEKNKVVLADIIVRKPDVLILDEPTNHLELSSVEKIEKALKEFGGGIIFVSHDRCFSEKIKTAELQL